jgi:hypothetical protein
MQHRPAGSADRHVPDRRLRLGFDLRLTGSRAAPEAITNPTASIDRLNAS